MQLMAKTEEPVQANAREEKIRRNLVRFVEESGYSQVQVADLAGMPQATLRRYMIGENAIPADVLEPLAAVFGRNEGDFFQDNPPPAPKNLQDIDEVSPLFLKSRPGFEPTKEDLEEFQRFLDGVRSRREKKRKK